MPIYFNHIPKTAGTSLRHSLSRLFDPTKCRPEWFLEDYLKVPKNNLNEVDFLAGHFGAYPLKLHPRKLQTITFLRDPVQRSHSHFLHIQNDLEHPANQIVREMTFSEFINSDLSEIELLNYQARFIGFSSIDDHLKILSSTGNRPALTNKLFSRKLLEQAKSTLNSGLFVGITEAYTESVDILSKCMGAPIENDARLNLAKSTPPLPDLSAADASRLHWLNEFDTELYNHAKLIWSQQAEMYAGIDVSSMPMNPKYFTEHIDFSSGWVGGGWGPVERHGGASYSWSSNRRPWIGLLLDTHKNHSFLARMATYDPEEINNLSVSVNGQAVSFSTHPCPAADGSSFSYIWFDLPREFVYQNGFVEIRFHINKTVNPKSDRGLLDDRDLGLYLNWARVQAL